MESAIISFIIPHRGRREFLLATLASVAALEPSNDRIEIIIVTQEPDLDGASLARWSSEQSGRVVIHQSAERACGSSIDPIAESDSPVTLTLKVLTDPASATISALRNRGVTASSGHYLAFLDADITLSPNWLSTMRAILAAQPARVITSAVQANAPQANPLERVRVALSNLEVDANLKFLPGRNLLLRRKTFDAIGGFPEHLITCEDYWFTNKASQLGDLYYSSAASYVHLGEDKCYLEMARKEIWRGQSNIHSVHGRHISLRESASFIAPLWIMIGMLTLIPGTLLLGGLALLGLLLAIMLPIALYSWRLLSGSRHSLDVNAVLGFYLFYFPARALGMLIGIAEAIKHIAIKMTSAAPRSAQLVTAFSSSTSPPVRTRPIRTLHFICSTGFYGAEKWILALTNNLDHSAVISELAVIRERDGDYPLKLIDEFRALGSNAHEISANGRFDPKMVGKLVRLLRERRIDVLHTHGYKSDILGALAARKAGVHSVCTPHGFENARDAKLRLFIWLGCQSFRFFDKVAPLSEQLCNEVRRYGIGAECLRMIENGVDLKPMEPFISGREPGQYHEAGPLTIGFIGQMIDRKNIRALLDVFDKLTAQSPTLQLELVGDGSERRQLERHAATLASHDRIHFLGFVDRPLAHLQQFDLFVMTSTLEGIPRSLMEAMAIGVPVAAFDIAGVDQLVIQGQTGLLARPGDHTGLVAHCAALLADQELSRRLAAAARRQVMERFSAARMARDYTSLYRSLTQAH